MKKDKNIGDNLHYSWEIEAQSKYFEDFELYCCFQHHMIYLIENIFQ